jgi:hypothetical protein
MQRVTSKMIKYKRRRRNQNARSSPTIPRMTLQRKRRKSRVCMCKTLYTSLWRLALGYNGNTQPPVRRLENQLLVPPGADEI